MSEPDWNALTPEDFYWQTWRKPLPRVVDKKKWQSTLAKFERECVEWRERNETPQQRQTRLQEEFSKGALGSSWNKV